MGHLRAAVTVEPFWHHVPGGTAVFLAETLREMEHLPDLELHGLAARSTGPLPERFEVSLPIHHARLARPLLYESWHRLGRPSAQSMVDADLDVIWAAAMVVPPRTAAMVVTVHDLDFLHHPERLSRRGRMFFPQCWEATKKRADIVVCPSEATAHDCRAFGIADDQLRVVHHGVRSEKVTERDQTRVRTQFGLPDEYVLWVGTVEPRKNLTGLVAALQTMPDVPLVVAGPAGWNVEASDLLAELGSRAVSVGEVAHGDLAALYAAAKVFVFPSLAEGFGLPVLEAMTQGTPVVTSAGTGTEEAAGGAAELVDPTRPESIAAGIRGVLDSDRRSEDLAALGRRRAAELTWAETARQYAAILQEAACRE